MLCHWPAVSRNLNFAASFARRFLELAPKERAAVLCAPQREFIPAYMAWDLALAICQARELVRVLEDAEEAWISALGENMQSADPIGDERLSSGGALRACK